MELTTYGYKNPDTDDTGEVFFPALNFNITRSDAHSHDGVDSTFLAVTAIEITTQAILPGTSNVNWGSDLGGLLYKQTITLPEVGTLSAQLAFDAISIEIRNTSNGERVYPRIEKNGTNGYDIYTNDNTSSWTALYTT